MDWLRLFEEQQVRFVALGVLVDRDLIAQMRAHSGWEAVIDDGEGVVFARSDDGPSIELRAPVE